MYLHKVHSKVSILLVWSIVNLKAREQIVSCVGSYRYKYDQNCGVLLALSAHAGTTFNYTRLMRVQYLSALGSCGYNSVFKRTRLMQVLNLSALGSCRYNI
jgi:hypothetical protein